MKRKAEKTWIMMALLLVSVSSMVKTSNSETREGAHAFNSHSTSSAVPATEWNETYGGPLDDKARSLVNTSDGGYALAGSTFSVGASNDFLLVKTDPTGTELWNETYGGGGDDEAYSVIQTSDGGYALAGSTTTSFGAGGSDAWLVKTYPDGTKAWSQTYGGASNDGAYSVIRAGAGYVLAGFTNSSGNGSYDFWLVKTDSSGNEVWSQTYGGIRNDEAYSVIQTSDGGYALAGSTTTSFGAGGSDAWLVKTDASGNMQWNMTYGGASDDGAYSVVRTLDGGYALGGFTNSSGNGSYDFWLVKTDPTGTELWNETYGGGGDDEAYSIVQAGDGGYVLAGYTNSYGAGGYDFWLVKTDASGNQQWNKTYGGQRDDEAYCVVQANGGGYALAGYTYSNITGNDFWLIKTAAVYYTLNITVTAGGTTDPTPGTYTYANWTDVTVTAHPVPGYLFDHWELDGNNSGTLRVFNSKDVLMDKDHQLKAVFVLSQVTLDITSSPGGTTDPTPGTYTYPYSPSLNQTVNVAAEPGYGNYLDHWVLDGIDTSTSTNVIPIFMNMSHTLEPVFRCPHDIAVINVASSKTIVGQNNSTDITYTVANVGKLYESFSIMFYANFTENNTTRLLDSEPVELVSGGNSSNTWRWSTSGFSKGNYTLIGSVGQVGNETITADNTFVSASILVTIPGDVNGDFWVGLSDLTALATHWASTPSSANWNPNLDIDNNGVVGLSDLSILANNFEKPDP